MENMKSLGLNSFAKCLLAISLVTGKLDIYNLQQVLGVV